MEIKVMDIATQERNTQEKVHALNQFFNLIMGIIVFSMQLGFTLLKKNVNNILTKASYFFVTP
jgi:hypothetical protein